MTKHRIPVRVVSPPAAPRRARVPEADSFRESAFEEPKDIRMQAEETNASSISSSDASIRVDETARALGGATEQAVQQVVPGKEQKTARAANETKERGLSYRSSEEEGWKERALRLQADMASYRQRQKRIAHEQAQTEQIALLKDVLAVADNLDRALTAAKESPGRRDEPSPLTEGVEMTRSALQRTLAKYGLEQFQAKGKSFDPAWHEAVHVVPASMFGARPGTVVEVLEDGYRRQGVLFRPAKVVVAQ